MEIEQVKDVQTPEQMRAELYRLNRHNAIARNVFEAANYSGASAEDRYTMLAYYALKALCRLEQDNLSTLMSSPFRMIAKDKP